MCSKQTSLPEQVFLVNSVEQLTEGLLLLLFIAMTKFPLKNQ